MIERIKELERLARRLEPDADERAMLARAAVEHAEAFIRSLAHAPGYRVTGDNGAGLYDSPLGPEPIGIEEALALLAKHVDSLGGNTAAGTHLGFIPGCPLYHSALGDFLAAISNRYAGHFYGSPGAVRMENLLLRWMADVVGYPESAHGNLTSGGSIANLIAITTAREAAGLRARHFERAVVYLTAQSHHSVERALRVAGLGECVRSVVPTDDRYRMDAGLLEEAIAADRKARRIPWLVAAAAGATDTGAVDPLLAIGEIALRHGLWFHADAAYGGFFALTAEGRRILRGLESSHSITLDPHKGLFTPYGTGAVLVRDRQALLAAHATGAAYMQDTVKAGEELSPADLSPELSKHFRGLRVWLPLKLLGTRPFVAALEEKLLLARHAHERLSELSGFEVGPPPELSIVTFRAVPERGNVDEFNRRLLAALLADGRLFLSSTTLDGKVMLRLAILAYRTHLDTVDLAIDLIAAKAREIAA
jgi:glutamate/tyrosine decarboxylase-like PLP-dependent enzyme